MAETHGCRPACLHGPPLHMQVTFEPESLPKVAAAPAGTTLASWKGELLLLVVAEEDFATESE